jgi:YgiT-type zinc finger domain-containing protein
MTIKENAACRECRQGRLKKSEVAQEFEREGLKVKIEGIPAYVCDHCGLAHYPPGVTGHVTHAASELFALSRFKRSGGYKAAL